MIKITYKTEGDTRKVLNGGKKLDELLNGSIYISKPALAREIIEPCN